jgi:hypothetical protein
MTYLFIIMTIGLINSIMKGSYIEIVGLNSMIIATVFIIDGDRLMRNEKTKTIEYNNLDNIRPDRESVLIDELQRITGLQIKKVDIEHIDYGKSRVVIKVYYY